MFTAQGYIPPTFDELLLVYMNAVNQFYQTNYTTETFIGSGHYKLGYVGIQLAIQLGTNFAELFDRIALFPTYANENIKLASISNQGIINYFARQSLVASVKETTIDTKGSVYACIDYTDDDLQPSIAGFLANSVAQGLFFEGSIEQPYTLSNGQTQTYKWSKPTLVGVDITYNIKVSQFTNDRIYTPSLIADFIRNSFAELYNLGRNGEFQKYLNILDGLAEFGADFNTSFDLTDPEQLIMLSPLNPSLTTTANKQPTLYLDYYQKLELTTVQVVIG